jgi:hypothetical protein
LKPFEIFRAGKHTATNGDTIDFSASDLAAMASGYDAAVHEAPIVVGHPDADAPAYGWVKGVTIQDGRVSVNPDQVDAAFAELVEAGRFKKVSASFYKPNDANNPKPGSYYLRHVGFLGAQPPAVKGLKPVSFADDGQALTFADWNGMTVAGLFRGLRELVIGQFGQDAADRALPSYQIDNLTVDAAMDDDDGSRVSPAYSERTEDLTTQAELDARARDLDAREAQLTIDNARFAERDRQIRALEFGTFLDPLIAQGRVLPVQKTGLVAFMETLHTSEPVSFGESDGKKTAPLDFLKGFLAAIPTAVDFSERASGELIPSGQLRRDLGTSTMAVRPERAQLEQVALSYMEKHPAVSFVQAVKAVEQAA